MNRGNFIRFLLELIGAFVVWMFHGFKGPFDNYMTVPDDYGLKSFRNLFIALSILFIALAVWYDFYKKSQKQKVENGWSYEVLELD